MLRPRTPSQRMQLAVAVAIAVYGLGSGAALAAVVGVLERGRRRARARVQRAAAGAGGARRGVRGAVRVQVRGRRERGEGAGGRRRMRRRRVPAAARVSERLQSRYSIAFASVCVTICIAPRRSMYADSAAHVADECVPQPGNLLQLRCRSSLQSSIETRSLAYAIGINLSPNFKASTHVATCGPSRYPRRRRDLAGSVSDAGCSHIHGRCGCLAVMCS